MSVLSRTNWVSQQRVDLSHFLAMESFTAADFRAIVSALTGNSTAYVARGFEVVSKSGLTAGIKVANSLVFNPLDGNGSFYIGLSDDADISVDLPADQTNVFVEATFTNITQAAVSLGQWDSLSLIGDDASGQEYSSSVDSQNIIQLEISVNTTGFTEGAIPLFRATTTTSSIDSFTDSRPMMFRLGTGGANPDPLNKYGWSGTRSEPVQSGAGVGDAVNSPWRSSDSSGAINDKSFQSLKDWMDAVMSMFSELTGSSIWYLSLLSSTGLSLSQLSFDTIGHSIQPSKNAAFKWKTVGGNLKLVSEGVIALNGTTGQYHSGLIKWRSNTSSLQWELGGTFAVATKRNFSSGAGLRFQSPDVVDGGNIYLALERDVPKGSGANVNWGSKGSTSLSSDQTSVSGSAGDFLGIALGDYIRKDSGTTNEYYKVIRFTDGSTIWDNSVASEENTIADSSIVALELESTTNPNATNISASSEPLKYFRSRYSSNDVVADTTANVYSYAHTSYYWLGRRDGDLFYLRDYGTMQEGEEATTLDVVYAQGNRGTGEGGLLYEHAKESVYDSIAGYSLKTGTGPLLTIRRRRRDNTVETPGAGDNSGSLLEYTITAPVGTMTVGQRLWVRLSDTTSGALSAGTVTNTFDDEENTDTVTNVYEILDVTDTPVRSFDNIDVYMVAQRIDINGQPALLFTDGSILTEFGQMINTNLDISGELRLNDYNDTAIPFLADDGSKLLDQDSTNFFFDKTAATFGLFNFRWQNNRLFQNVPEDVALLDNLGAHTAVLGTADSTIVIPGDLIVEGDSFAVNVGNVQSEDKLISLGVGSPVNGAYGGGIELADDTKTSTQIDSTLSSADVVLTYSVAHGYTTGDIIGVNTEGDVGGITAGQIGGQYTFVASATLPGEAQVLTPTTLKLVSRGSATSTATNSTNPPKTFVSPWSIRLGDPEGTYIGTNSWIFRVKGVTTAPAVTPVVDYGIVPTAHSVNMLSGRIPFTNDDNNGPLGVDSTLNFTANFSWDNALNTLNVAGIVDVTEYVVAGRMVQLEETTDLLGPTPLPTGTDINIFSRGTLTYQQDSFGNQKLLTNAPGSVFEEIVDIVTTPSGNNQHSAISVSDIITLPQDTKYLIGNQTSITTDGSTSTVIVNLYNHGLVGPELITVYATNPVGGISAVNLSVSGVAISVIDANHFYYTAGAASTFVESGYVDKITAQLTRYYIVGERELEIYDNGVLQTRGVDYVEVGTAQTQSNQIQWLKNIPVGDPTGNITYRIDANGGQIIVNQSGVVTLQGAYNGGNSLTTTSGNPVTINGPVSESLLVVNGDMTVTGLII